MVFHVVALRGSTRWLYSAVSFSLSSSSSTRGSDWDVSRAEYVELSRDVHDAYVESSIAQAKSIEPLSSVGNGIDPHRFAKCTLKWGEIVVILKIRWA